MIFKAQACPPNDTRYMGGFSLVLYTGTDYTHPYLGNARYGYDFVDNDSDPSPDNPHAEEHRT